MIDSLLPITLDDNAPIIVKEKKQEIKQRGMIHSKVSGKFEIVKELPKEANNFDEIFKYADAFGQLRFAYINNVRTIAPTAVKENKSASAFGGEIGINTASYAGFNFHVSAYISQSVNFLNPSDDKLNNDFVNTDNNSFIYLAEASVDYTSSLLQTKIGRIKIETPYADSDDIRMAANTFVGAWANINYTSSLTTQIAYLNKWAGYDSQDATVGDSQDKFKDLVSDESFGMALASLTYEYSDNSEASLWYSYIDELCAITYAEVIGIYFIDGKRFHIDYGVQASNQKELANSGVSGSVLGAMSIIHYQGLFFGASYNKVYADDGNSITDGFGGGPYYTSLDESSIALLSEYSPGENLYAYRIGFGYNLKKTGIDKLNGYLVELVTGSLSNNIGSIDEQNIILTYKRGEKWYIEGIFTHFDSSYNDNTFERTIFRAHYSF